MAWGGLGWPGVGVGWTVGGVWVHPAPAPACPPPPPAHRAPQAADIYLLPYRDRITSNSGTLSMAMAAGKAIVTTPFEHARFALAGGRAIFVDFDSTPSIERALGALLADREGRAELGQAAKAGTERLAWSAVGREYAALLQQLAALQLAGGDGAALREALGAPLLASRNGTAAYFSGGAGALVTDPAAYSVSELKGLAKLADMLKGNHLNKVLHDTLLGHTGAKEAGAGAGAGAGAASGAGRGGKGGSQHLAGAAQEVEDAGASGGAGQPVPAHGSSGLGSSMMHSIERQAHALLGARRGLLGAAGEQQRQQQGRAGGDEDPNAVLLESDLGVSLRLRSALAAEDEERS